MPLGVGARPAAQHHAQEADLLTNDTTKTSNLECFVAPFATQPKSTDLPMLDMLVHMPHVEQPQSVVCFPCLILSTLYTVVVAG